MSYGQADRQFVASRRMPIYIVSKIANVSFERTLRATMPFIGILILVLFVITYIRWLVTFLPRLVLS